MSEASRALGIAGTVAVLLLWGAPLNTVFLSPVSVFRTKATTSLATGFNFIAALFNCIFWVLFTCTRLETLFESFFVNALGIAVNLSLVSCYWYFSRAQQRHEANLQIGLFALLLLLTLATWAVVRDNEFISLIAMVVNILMYFGPLLAVTTVCRTRSVASMPLPPLIMTFISSVIWTAYAIEVKEITIVIPNIAGIFFGALQVSIWTYVRCRLEPSQGILL